MSDKSYWKRMLSPYTEEAIPRRQTRFLPPLLRKARDLEKKKYSRLGDAVLFYEEGILLADYTDDTIYSDVRSLYYPTYHVLDDRELRGYFGWRTRLRAGRDEDAPLTYLFIYIYELLNNIGVVSPRDGYERLQWVMRHYGDRAPKILLYMDQWIYDYVLYHALPVELLPKRQDNVLDKALIALSEVTVRDPAEVISAVKVLAPAWLQRSRFYAANSKDMDTVLMGVLRGYVAHYSKSNLKGNILTSFFGQPDMNYYNLMSSAVFRKEPRAGNNRVYRVNSVREYKFFGNACWECSYADVSSSKKLGDLIKYIDAQLRKASDYGHPIQQPTQPKWVVKLVDDEIAALHTRKNAVKPLVFDTADLARIRADAAVTQARLAVADEIGEEAGEEAAAPVPSAPIAAEESAENSPPAYGGLTAQETRYLRSLLLGEETGWVRAEGLLPSVLADGINDKLYEEFVDTVLATDGEIAVLEDYADELKEALGL